MFEGIPNQWNTDQISQVGQTIARLPNPASFQSFFCKIHLKSGKISWLASSVYNLLLEIIWFLRPKKNVYDIYSAVMGTYGFICLILERCHLETFKTLIKKNDLLNLCRA